MSKIFIPANEAGDWKQLLAQPNKQWRTGYSAKTLAYCWQETQDKTSDFPECVRGVFMKSEIPIFQDIELLLAFPEYKVPLPGGKRASQNDIFVLARGNNQLVSITVEGKVRESFGELVNEWRKKDLGGKQERLNYLLDWLQLSENKVSNIRYQLLHRTVSALIEADKFKAKNALMLVHSFSQDNECFDDYKQFLALFDLDAKPDSIVFAKNLKGINLYFG